MTALLDVNASFAAERTSQFEAAAAATAAWDQRVADGKLVPLGNGRFRVNEPGSWDNGEIFMQQANGIAIPQSGLDLRKDGTARLYTAVPTWHSLEGAGLIPGGTTDIEQVLKLSGGDYHVEARKVRYSFDGELMELPGRFVNVRTDTGAGFDVVGKIYTPVQNRQAFEFLQDLVAMGEGVIWESAGPLRNGARFFISLKLPGHITVDAGGINDHVQMFVAVINSHDGETPFICIVTPWRPICGNTERFALRDAKTRWTVRHTKNAMTRIDEARRTMGLSSRYFEEFAAEETKLARNPMTFDEFRTEVVDHLWERKADEDLTKRSATTVASRDEALEALWATEAERVGRTAYAAERAITDYLDHVAPKRVTGDKLAAARATAVMEDDDGKAKSKVHAKLMLRVA